MPAGASIDRAPDFTIAGFRTGAEALGTFGAASTFRSTFAPRRLHDGAVSYRLFAFQDACSCYRYVSAPRPAS